MCGRVQKVSYNYICNNDRTYDYSQCNYGKIVCNYICYYTCNGICNYGFLQNNL